MNNNLINTNMSHSRVRIVVFGLSNLQSLAPNHLWTLANLWIRENADHDAWLWLIGMMINWQQVFSDHWLVSTQPEVHGKGAVTWHNPPWVWNQPLASHSIGMTSSRCTELVAQPPKLANPAYNSGNSQRKRNRRQGLQQLKQTHFLWNNHQWIWFQGTSTVIHG
jgi:hypothetical protein